MNTTGLRQKRVAWLLDHVENWECYDLAEPKGAKAKLEFACNRIIEEGAFHLSNLRRYGNYQKALSEYLKGLPTWCSIPFTNHDISELLKSWGYTWDDETKETQAVANYWGATASLMLQLFAKYDINFTKDEV